VVGERGRYALRSKRGEEESISVFFFSFFFSSSMGALIDSWFLEVKGGVSKEVMERENKNRFCLIPYSLIFPVYGSFS